MGDIWDTLGYDKEECKHCGTRLKDGICLNGCHLSKGSMDRFSKLMKEAEERVNKTEK